jgi:hypothetical protein
MPWVSPGSSDDRKRNLVYASRVLPYLPTFLGGNDASAGLAIAVDENDSAYITGYTFSNKFPAQSVFQAMLRGNANAFVTKLTPAGNSLVYIPPTSEAAEQIHDYVGVEKKWGHRSTVAELFLNRTSDS